MATTKKAAAKKTEKEPQVAAETVAAPSEAPKGEAWQPTFGPGVPTATVHKFLVEGAPGVQEEHYFEGRDAEQQARDYMAANHSPAWFWTLNTGSRAVQAIPAVDAGAEKAR